MIVNKTTFAEMAGITQAMVTLGIKRGKLAPNADGNLDTDQPDNAIYLAKRRQKGKAPPVVGVRKPKPRKTAAARSERTPPPDRIIMDSGLDDIEDIQGLKDLEDINGPDRIYDQADKTQADVEYKKTQTALGKFKLQYNKKQVYRRSNVEKMVAKLKQELKSRFQDMPRRLTPRFASMVRAGVEDKEIESSWLREIDSALESVNEVMKHIDE